MTAIEIANELNRIYDTALTNDLVTVLQTDALLVDVLLLCTQYKQPIKARINTPNWLRVEWISPTGQCLSCHQREKLTVVKGSDDEHRINSQRETTTGTGSGG